MPLEDELGDILQKAQSKKSMPCFLAMRRRVVRHYMDTLGRASSMS